jgi:pimeloyl-ACP methyl ester carboxylesterase
VPDDVRIASHGEQLAAYVYRPAATNGDAPCVVMAHGFSATRDDGLPGYAAMTAPEAKPGFGAIVPPNSKWRNEFATRLMLRFAFYRPGRKASRLNMPLLICVCDDDATTPVAPAVKAAERAPRAELRRYPYGHFDIYHDPQVKADHVAFLQRTVQGVAA